MGLEETDISQPELSAIEELEFRKKLRVEKLRE